MTTNIASGLKGVIDNFNEKPFLIVVTQVDPDALGSACGLAEIIRILGGKVELVYCGYVAHPQNRAIFNRYNLETVFKSIADFTTFDGYNVCLVDSSTIGDVRLGPFKRTFKPVIVIDHHRGHDFECPEVPYCLIEEVGACATLIVEIINELNLVFDESKKYLSYLLALGIYTDTKSLISAGERDRTAFGEITKNISETELSKMIEYPLPDTYYRNMKHALQRMEQRGSRVLTNIGYIKPDEGDDLSTIADLLIRHDGVSLVVVWGVIGDKVRISSRNRDISVSLLTFMKERFGERSGAKLTPDGRGEGGAILDLNFYTFWLCDTNRSVVADAVNLKLQSLVFPTEE
ncbi:TPA: hypothetical protein DF272_05945 [Candidatus Falkowbacteria bacterium]|nr:hypothetical protein [Candidatus Falkowbacteria bacterium]